jgi:anti-sigma regulatory factor (Ser/Thr protein kinase)
MSEHLSVDIARDVRAPATARRAVERLSFLGETLSDVKLLVSELVTNAVKYGEGAVHLDVSSGAGCVRVEVVDDGRGFVPEARDRPATEVGGWGLPTVAAIADRWGVYEASTHVWFELDRRPPEARSDS